MKGGGLHQQKRERLTYGGHVFPYLQKARLFNLVTYMPTNGIVPPPSMEQAFIRARSATLWIGRST